MTDEAARGQHEETIVAVKPGFGAARRPRARGSRRIPRLPLAAIAVLLSLGLAAAVFFVLPGWVEERAVQTPAPAPAQPLAAAPTGPVLSPEELAALRERAESLLAELLQQRSHLEARSAADWAGPQWSSYEAASREGDDALLAEEFQTAIDRYVAAREAGEALLARAEQIVAAALAAGDRAVTAGDARLAADQYAVVLGIEPQNAAALQGRARAERLPEVLALMQRADLLRQNREWPAAAELYRQALAIDAQWAPARAALGEVTGALATARLDALLSRGFAALANEDYREAQEHFGAALALDPRSESAQQGLAQAAEGEKLDAIALSEARALAFERRELWPAAIERYEAALAEDATLAFAIAGLERARARADLDNKLVNLIDNPNLLFTDSVLDAARAIVEQARPFAEPDSRIATQVERLEQLIRVASTPVPVRIDSDGATEVTVYRVGALGAFSTREIEVRPGTYTAVGSRNGYRDVRVTFNVVPGRPTPPVGVVCREPI